jgi:hypothetical protein
MWPGRSTSWQTLASTAHQVCRRGGHLTPLDDAVPRLQRRVYRHVGTEPPADRPRRGGDPHRTDGPRLAPGRMAQGPQAGLDLLAAVDADGRLANHHLLEAVRGRMLEMAGHHAPARESYRLAARRTTSLPEQALPGVQSRSASRRFRELPALVDHLMRAAYLCYQMFARQPPGIL